MVLANLLHMKGKQMNHEKKKNPTALILCEGKLKERMLEREREMLTAVKLSDAWATVWSI